jgi:hypothetical protein
LHNEQYDNQSHGAIDGHESALLFCWFEVSHSR